ncbi:MAG: Microfibrillar-associated protein 1, partial [Marteilia pararefringens]
FKIHELMPPKRNERHDKKIDRHLGTANAISMVNTEGKWETIKVKTSRYIPGKVPEFANDYENDSDNNEDGIEIFKNNSLEVTKINSNNNYASSGIKDSSKSSTGSSKVFSVDPRAQRLMKNAQIINSDHRNLDFTAATRRDDNKCTANYVSANETQLPNRGQLAAQLLAQHDKDMEIQVHKKQEEDSEEESFDESNEDEDYTDSDDEKLRVKPVFVRQRDRITLNSKQKDFQEYFNDKNSNIQAKNEHKNQILSAIEKEMKMKVENPGIDIDKIAIDFDSDLGDEDIEFQQWKIRELQRIKRDKEEVEQMRKEKEEINKIHEMSEEKRLEYLIKNPKIITNYADKGKYNFLQKYYHRGVFYLDNEDNLLKRNVDLPSMDDNFDRTKLPKIMQVRNFGKASRTKYTHLVSEDTNEYLNPLNNNATIQANNTRKGAGMKNTFERPSNKK